MKLLITLVVLLLLGAVADVIAEETAETKIADRLEGSIDGADPVDVELQGRPFLLQAVRGNFNGLEITVGSVQRQGVAVQDVNLVLRDVEFSLGQLLEDGEVKVGGGDGSGAISERALNAALRREGVSARVSLDGSRATVSVGGLDQPVDSVAVADGGLEFTASNAGGLRLTLPDLLPSRDRVRYTDARVEGGRVVLLFELPTTSFEAGSL